MGKEQKRDNERTAIGHNEDVVFSERLADKEDLEALERAEEADRRQEKGE